MAGHATTTEPGAKAPRVKPIIGAGEISLSSSASVQTVLGDEEILRNRGHHMSSSAAVAFSSSAIFIGHNEDLLTQAFLRLPPKSLLRFQCVSKQWLSIISNSDFRRLHCRKFRSNCSSSDAAALFLFRLVWRTTELDFIAFNWEDVKPIGTLTSRLRNFLSGEILWLHSCNGLLCIDFHLDYDFHKREFIVYNPTTGDYRLIPKCKVAAERYKRPADINIAFDPLKSDHYKLVCLWVEQQDDNVYHVLVYSSETGIWRDTGEAIEMRDDPYFGNGILWNGNLHWTAVSKSVLCFDLDNECLNLSVPSLPMGGNDYWCFGESGGCLCAIVVNHSQAMLADVFELKSDYSKWFLKFSIDLNPLTVLYPSMLVKEYYSQFQFPHFLVCEKEKIAKIVISLVGKVILYNFNDMTVKELADVEPLDPCLSWMDLYDWHQTVTFTETLACV